MIEGREVIRAVVSALIDKNYRSLSRGYATAGRVPFNVTARHTGALALFEKGLCMCVKIYWKV